MKLEEVVSNNFKVRLNTNLGPLAGPVVAAACIVDISSSEANRWVAVIWAEISGNNDFRISGIIDSKKTTEQCRESTYEKLINTSGD